MSPFSRFLPLSALLAASAFADNLPADVQQNQLQRQQQRTEEQQHRMQHTPDVRLDDGVVPASGTVGMADDAETPCFAVRGIRLAGNSADRFRFALRKALKQSGFKTGDCLGAQGINRIMTLAQNALIGRGYTTTRILAAPQDLNGGVLELTVLPGRIRSIRIDTERNEETRASRIAAFQNEFPTRNGNILNLRHLEQGLENLKRIPTAETDIRIEPAEAPDESDVVVMWKQRQIPFRISIGADDSGSKATGKYQGSMTLSADNPFRLSDLFYASYNHDLGHKDSHTDNTGKHTGSGTNGYSLHYSVPFGNWLLSWNRNYYRYHQAVAGLTENYDYNGKSTSYDVGFTRLMYRDARRKTYFGAKLWRRDNKSFINDAEIDVQRRRSGGWAVSLNHREYLGRATLDATVGYKRGTGLSGSLEAPEQAFGEGTSRMRIITADLSLNLPFQLGRRQFFYDGRWHGQWNKSWISVQIKL